MFVRDSTTGSYARDVLGRNGMGAPQPCIMTVTSWRCEASEPMPHGDDNRVNKTGSSDIHEGIGTFVRFLCVKRHPQLGYLFLRAPQ
jgi:hypothetical protein